MNDLEITAADQLWKWLDIHHAQDDSVRLVTWKASHPDKYVSRDEVLDALIAHGWIDGRRFVVDDTRTAQLISPRKQIAWAKSYKDRVDKLRTQGRMHAAGEAAVAAGQASGLWTFYDDVDALIVPQDLADVVKTEAWEALAPSYRRNVLRWIKLAKTPATRTKRIRLAADATNSGEQLPQM
ncbi:MAG: YdeI/OmpD-associated family protein [Pseudomonadota bacterium]